MILLVATNPTIDRTITVPVLTPHAVHRSTSVHVTAGGKAINVARAAHCLGTPVKIAGFSCGYLGAYLQQLVADEGLEASWEELEHGETKTSILMAHAEGDTTVINEPGPQLCGCDWHRFCDRVISNAYGCQAAVLAGSIPPGPTAQQYSDLCQRLRSVVPFVCVDTPGETLKATVRNPAGLCIKVNHSELADAMNLSQDNLGQLTAAMRSLIGAGARLCIVTLGKDGALGATRDGIWKVGPAPIKRLSTVGSGDSFTAGLVSAQIQGFDLRQGLQLAAACGAANAETPYPASFSACRAQELAAGLRAEYIM